MEGHREFVGIVQAPTSHIKNPSYPQCNLPTKSPDSPVQSEGIALDPGFLRVAAEFNVVAAASVEWV